MNEILYQVVAVDSDLIKGYPDKVRCFSENENMDNGVIYNDYDFKNHRYIKTYVSDNFDIYDKYKEQEEKIYNLQSKIDKAVEYINSQKKTISKGQAYLFNEDRDNKSKLKIGTFMWNVDELLDILKEDK